MDVNYPLAVVGTADRNIHVYNLTNPQTPFKIMPSPLKFQVPGQAGARGNRSRRPGSGAPCGIDTLPAPPLYLQTRCVTAFPDKTGFLVGSIEGRVGVQQIGEDAESKSKTFTFKVGPLFACKKTFLMMS